MKIDLTDVFKSMWDDKFHFQANVGPFETPEEAAEFARKVAELAPKDEAPQDVPVYRVLKDLSLPPYNK